METRNIYSSQESQTAKSYHESKKIVKGVNMVEVGAVKAGYTSVSRGH